MIKHHFWKSGADFKYFLWPSFILSNFKVVATFKHVRMPAKFWTKSRISRWNTFHAGGGSGEEWEGGGCITFGALKFSLQRFLLIYGQKVQIPPTSGPQKSFPDKNFWSQHKTEYQSVNQCWTEYHHFYSSIIICYFHRVS